jgi:Golgi phosphoprotein 3
MNDTISYVLRGCIILELALRKRIRFVEGQRRSGKSLPERHIELVDGRPTGEVLLDETMRMMRTERHSIGGWIDLLSGTITIQDSTDTL